MGKGYWQGYKLSLSIKMLVWKRWMVVFLLCFFFTCGMHLIWPLHLGIPGLGSSLLFLLYTLKAVRLSSFLCDVWEMLDNFSPTLFHIFSFSLKPAQSAVSSNVQVCQNGWSLQICGTMRNATTSTDEALSFPPFIRATSLFSCSAHSFIVWLGLRAPLMAATF